MSISQNFPNIDPALRLNFQGARRLDPRITFERASIGTYVDEDGLIKTATADEARFDHDPETGESLGLLIEEQRTNLITYNTAIGGTGWVYSPIGNTFITQNYGIAPDETQTATRIFKDSADGANLNTIYTQGAFITTASQKYAISAFVKVLSGQNVVNMEWDPNNFGGGRSRVVFDLDNLTTTETHINSNPGSSIDGSGIEVYPNGWYRIYFYVTVQSSGGLGSNGAIIQLNRYTNFDSDTLWWGVQTENATFHTSFIKTEANHVTRQPDKASITGTNFTDFYNQTKGTVLVEYDGGRLTSFPAGYGRLATTESWSMEHGSSGTIRTLGVTGGVYNNFTALVNTYTNFTKYAISIENSTYVSAASDGILETSINGAVTYSTTATKMNIGSTTTNVYQPNGHIKQLIYYPERLTDTQLQNLTK